jgi:AraC family transcriptional regulator of adaptative response / DNA-3-methyladenine glycosylase II
MSSLGKASGQRRARAIQAFASACAAGELRFNATLSPEAMMARLMSLPPEAGNLIQ